MPGQKTTLWPNEGRSMVSRLEAGDFIGVGIRNLGLETLTCLEPRKNVLAVDGFSCSAAYCLQGRRRSSSSVRRCLSKTCKAVKLHRFSVLLYS